MSTSEHKPYWNLVEEHFELSDIQRDRLLRLYALYEDWNAKINVVSRKNFEEFYLRHVLHSLSVLKFVTFRSGTKVIDLGTGGGFPGIPLAILCEDVEFFLIDSLRKKTTVVADIIDQLGLKNARVTHTRAEDYKQKAHFVVAKAVTRLERLHPWAQRLVSEDQKNALPNGLLCLKGGDPKQELASLPKGEYTELWWLQDQISVDYFDQKYLLYVQV